MQHDNKLLFHLVLIILFMSARQPINLPPQAAAGNADPQAARQLTLIEDFGANLGNITMYKYVPASVPERASLVVSLHGCKQNAAIYAQNGWLDLVDQWEFYLLFPEQ